MLWGHAAKAMIDSLKANARPKRRPFDREVEARGPAIRKEYLREASEEELAYWRSRMMNERRLHLRRSRIFLVVVLIALATILL